MIREVLGGSALPVLLLPDSPYNVDDPVKVFLTTGGGLDRED
jgi:hypothetical protein